MFRPMWPSSKGDPLKCWSPSDDGHYWPKYTTALFYYLKTLLHLMKFKANFTYIFFHILSKFIIYYNLIIRHYTGCPRRKGQHSVRSHYRSFSEKKCICTCVLFRTVSEIVQYTVQTSNTPCPHMSCKARWCWRWNFRKFVTLGKLHQLCHLNDKYRH
jgi:hypothetical protein